MALRCEKVQPAISDLCWCHTSTSTSAKSTWVGWVTPASVQTGTVCRWVSAIRGCGIFQRARGLLGAWQQDIPATDAMFRLLSVLNCSATRECSDKGAQTERYHLSVYIKGHRDGLNNEEGLVCFLVERHFARYGY